MHYKNYEINPIDLENLLLSHPDVIRAEVVPIPDKVDGDLPMAFIEKTPGSKVI